MSATQLELLLHDWRQLLSLWAQSGALSRAAQDALRFESEPPLLGELLARWAAGDFSDLPPLELLPAASLPGAAGAYAIHTGTIYLNEDWLLSAKDEDVMAVLTEELGHHLDAVLNIEDTPGDEGYAFSQSLLWPEFRSGTTGQIDADVGFMFYEGRNLPVEMSTFAPAGRTVYMEYLDPEYADDPENLDRLTLLQLFIESKALDQGVLELGGVAQIISTLYEYKDIFGLFTDLQKTIQEDKSFWELAPDRQKFIEDIIAISVNASLAIFAPKALLAGLVVKILIDSGIAKPLSEAIRVPLQSFEGYYGKIPITEAILDGRFDAYPEISELANQYVTSSSFKRENFESALREAELYDTFISILSGYQTERDVAIPNSGAARSTWIVNLDGNISLASGIEDLTRAC